MTASRRTSLLALTALALSLFGELSGVHAASKYSAKPVGGCPMPVVSLMINEFQLGTGPQPRWLELYNPSPVAVNLKGTVLRISNKDINKDGSIEFALGETVPTLPAGEVLLLGHIPKQAGDMPFYALQLVNLGMGFQLPACATKIELFGSQGVLDSHKWDLCTKGVPDKDAWQAVKSLDPDHTDLCLSDDVAVWCTTTAKDSPAKPSPGKVNQPCDLDGDGYTTATGDCDDKKKQVNPLANELCNGVDDNCDGSTDEQVVAPPETCLVAGICGAAVTADAPVAKCAGAKGFICDYPPGFESVAETLCDGYDNDCDGETDEGLLNACGECGPLAVELCNGTDDDCDGETDEDPTFLALQCGGQGVCSQSKPTCGPGGVGACAMPLTYQATETLCDGRDNDCDGATDEELGLGQTCVIGEGVCSVTGVITCAANGETRCEGAVDTPLEEVCGDNLDNDCDGETDEGFDLGAQCTVGLGVCSVNGKRVCGAGDAAGEAVCDAEPMAPQGPERCGNHLDDDCDGMTDEPGCEKEPSSGGCSAGGPNNAHGALVVLLLAALILTRRRFALL